MAFFRLSKGTARVLCVGAETLSKITDFTDRGTCVLLADAAGAAVLEPSTDDKRWGVDHSMDAIRDKFGRTSVGYAAVALSDAERVPEEFRELAERGPGGNRDGGE